MSPTIVGIIGIGLFFLLVALGLPLAFSFAVVGVGGFAYLKGIDPGLSLLGILPYTWSTHYTLMTIPLFILMGHFSFHSGISGDLFSVAHKWLGRLPGGLALATNLACTGFAACTGSSVAAAATMGTVAIPEMKRFNYDPKLATGSVAAGGTLGILIPPSTGFILYGVLTEQSIGKLFIAGIFPGLVISASYMLTIILLVRRNPGIAPAGPSSSWKEKLSSMRGVWGMLFIFVLVMGGIYGGVFTPTEAAAVGSFGTLLIVLIRKRFTRQAFLSSLLETGRTTCMIFFIVIGAMVFNAFLGQTRLPIALAELISGLDLAPRGILALILLLYVPLGMVMDALAMIILTIPIIFPVVQALGFDPIWFGVLMVLMIELALLTPPVGMNVYVIKGVVKDEVSMEDIFRGVLPFIIVHLIGVVILVALPQISLFLPATMK